MLKQTHYVKNVRIRSFSGPYSVRMRKMIHMYLYFYTNCPMKASVHIIILIMSLLFRPRCYLKLISKIMMTFVAICLFVHLFSASLRAHSPSWSEILVCKKLKSIFLKMHFSYIYWCFSTRMIAVYIQVYRTF